MTKPLDPPPCGCASCGAAIRDGLARRGFVRLLSTSTAALAFTPLASTIAKSVGNPGYQAMLLSCIDPRTQQPIAAWMDSPAPDSHSMALTGLYSQFSIAGASGAVIAPAFNAWRQIFWDNLASSIQLHKINTLIAVDHGSCGAFGIAYGQEVLADPALELKTHMDTVTALQKEVAARHPQLNYQAHYISRDAQGAFTQWKVLVPGRIIG